MNVTFGLRFLYSRVYGHLVATYESASTRRFLHVSARAQAPNNLRLNFLVWKLIGKHIFFQGRVDCIRSASTEALNWVKAMCQGAGANIPLDGEDDGGTNATNRKVKFEIYSVNASFSKKKIIHATIFV